MDVTNNTLSIDVAKVSALGPVTFSNADVITLADTGANVAALAPSLIGTLSGKGIDKIDASDNALTLSVGQFQQLGDVSLTSADTVTLKDIQAALTGLDFATLAARGIDRLDADTDALTLSLAKFNTLGAVQLTTADAVTVTGGAGADVFTFITQTFTGNDSVVGDAGSDSLTLGGNYAAGLVFGADSLSSIGRIGLKAGGDYSLTTHDNNVSAGGSLTILATSLGIGDSLIFDGSAESNGSFKFQGGAGDNTFTGGSMRDEVTAASGIDTIRYTSPSQSTATNYDTIVGFNFGQDRFDVVGSVTSVSATGGALSNATMNAQLTAALSGLANDTAAMFTATSGNLVGETFLVIDQNNAVGYQAGGDLVVRLTGATGSVNPATNFI